MKHIDEYAVTAADFILSDEHLIDEKPHEGVAALLVGAALGGVVWVGVLAWLF